MMRPPGGTPGIVAAGLILGTAYTVSPLSVWLCLGTVALFAWAGRGLSPSERRKLWTLLALGIGARLLVVGALYVMRHGDPYVTFPWEPDSRFQKMRSVWMSNLWLGIPMPPEYAARAFGEPEAWTSYLYVIALLQTMFGPSTYAIHFFNIMLFMVAAVALYRLARASYGNNTAFWGLALMLSFPTLFLWSVTALKEATYLLLGVLSLVGLMTALGSGPISRRAGGVGLTLACVVLIGTVRIGGDAITAGAVVLGAIAVFLARRPVWMFVPAVVMCAFCAALILVPSVAARTRLALADAAHMHIGHVRTEGFVYKLLEPRFYDVLPISTTYLTITPAEATRFVIRAVISVVAVPLPWQPYSTLQLSYIPFQMAWYLMALLAVIGVVEGFKRDPVLTSALVAFVAAGLGAVALVSGNVGTLVRHRDGYLPFMVWFTALGTISVLSKCAPAISVPSTSGDVRAGA